VVTLGQRIRERRLELGITLREFARRVGVSAPYLTDLEAGRRHPGPEVLVRIAEALGLPPAELEALDTRLSPEVRRWVETQPEVARLLRTLQTTPRRRREEMLRRLRRMVDEDRR
jgi:transcriptional regulator with XRE-family HTH domain